MIQTLSSCNESTIYIYTVKTHMWSIYERSPYICEVFMLDYIIKTKTHTCSIHIYIYVCEVLMLDYIIKNENTYMFDLLYERRKGEKIFKNYTTDHHLQK